MPLQRFWLGCIGCVLLVSLLWGCALPQVRAEDRLFLNVSVEYRGELSLPAGTLVDGTVVGGLSGLTYDPQQQQFYAISDDRQQPRFYGLALSLPSAVSTYEGAIEPKFVTFLTQANGDLYPANTADTEGIGLTPDGRLMISSEGVTATSSLPWIKEFVLNGQQERALPIPAYYLPEETGQKGIRNNLGFEALTLSPTGDRLFVGVESALSQDLRPNQPIYCRLLHYLRGDVLPVLLAEHVYPLDPAPAGSIANGLVELLALDNGGHFLSLERTYSPQNGYGIKLFEMSLAGATDTLGMAILPVDLPSLQPVRKRLILDLTTLGIPLTNLEGMALGYPFADGSRSLWIIGDNNFDAQIPTQALVFRVQF